MPTLQLRLMFCTCEKHVSCSAELLRTTSECADIVRQAVMLAALLHDTMPATNGRSFRVNEQNT